MSAPVVQPAALEDILQPVTLRVDTGPRTFVSDADQSLLHSIGLLEEGRDLHFYSFGNFNLVRLIMHLLKQTGPAHLFMTSYSFSQRSIEQIKNRLEQGQLLSFRVIVDNRVRTMSPKPFQMLSTSFNYRCTSIHAKVALLWNDQWHLSIVTSQNATDNPKMERGVIQTDPQVFAFDLKNLEDAFNRGTT
jgi:hypothetical protein